MINSSVYALKEYKFYLSEWKKKQIEEHLCNIISVRKEYYAFELYYVITFSNKPAVNLSTRELHTPKKYTHIFFTEFGELPPAMDSESWRYFLHLLNTFESVEGGV